MGVEISYLAGNSLVSIEFDATVRELHTSSVTLTEHPVEKGANISDHVRPELTHLTCEALVTNHPIRLPRTNMQGVSGRVQALDLAWRIGEESVRKTRLEIPKRTEIPIGVPLVGALITQADLLDGTEVREVDGLVFTPGPDGAAAQVLQFDGEFDRVRSVYEELLTLQASATLLTVNTSIKEYDNLILQNLTAPREIKDGASITFTFDLREIRFATTQTVKVSADKKRQPAAKTNLGAKPTEPVERRSLLHKLLH
jgi:hypothetical protein